MQILGPQAVSAVLVEVHEHLCQTAVPNRMTCTHVKSKAVTQYAVPDQKLQLFLSILTQLLQGDTWMQSIAPRDQRRLDQRQFGQILPQRYKHDLLLMFS